MPERAKALAKAMLHPNAPGTSPSESASTRAYAEVRTSTDPALLRGACAAVGGEKDRRMRQVLYTIIATLGANLGDETAGPFLIQRLAQESDKYVLLFMLDGISRLRLPPPTDLTPILRCLDDPRWQVRNTAIDALRGTDSPLAEEALIKLLQTSRDPFDLSSTNAALSRIGTARALPAIEPHLQSRKRDVKLSARFAIHAIRERDAG
jgi:HEAT repeat protein